MYNRASGVVAPDSRHRYWSIRMPQVQNTSKRLWHKNTPIPISICPWCGREFTKNSPRQKFCTIRCQAKESESRHPRRIWGTPEYYKRKELEVSGLKKCKECKGTFPLDNYWTMGKTKSGKDARCVRCKECAAKYQHKHRKHYKDNPEISRKRSKEYREKHPELCKQRIKDWQDRHPENRTATAQRRRIRTTQNGLLKITANDLRRLFIRQVGCCYLCGYPIVGKKHLDHIIPVKRGGRHSIGNVAWTHPKCNQCKSAKLLVEVRYAAKRKPCIAISSQLS